VSEDLPLVTVLIPTRPDQIEIGAVTASRSLDYPADKLEILVARGKHPSVQRNAGMKAARGELIYFLDDDSLPEPGNVRRALSHFQNSDVTIVGGPNLCPPDAPPLEQKFALVLASWLAFGPSRARYFPVGPVREASEKELILCNLMARRQTMLDLGGFNEALYPNEENALMDELQKRGGKMIYDPHFIVRRRPRPTLKAFARMAMTYGRGRAEQVRVHPTPGSIINFIPAFFVVYLALMLPAFFLLGPMVFIFLAFYAVILLLQAAVLAASAGPADGIGAIPLIVLTQILYGVGIWRGLFTTLKTGGPGPITPVTLERM
jgi:succinoglycan biosynthesis protein ExoA